MVVAFWIVAGLTALGFLAAGANKLARPKAALATGGLSWTDDFGAGPVKLIGAAEVLGAFGLILPALLRIVPILSPIAGVALAVLMVGAIATHIRRKEAFVLPLVLGLLAVASAVLGFLAVI
ncbi:MAG: DoxX family protein [Microbacterium sp.]|uniref:DoxX family protein n=1 Tax=Microbacterium sp. TaxID=51671 RepID=UPI001D80A295|nr:DoxX family protein [Microbacterium sp.]MBW8764615.1 DoxX family protein [Microbacterium sp.]